MIESHLKLVTDAVVEPVSVSEAKAHLRVDTSADDTPITALIVAARQHAEAVTRRALITQTWDLVMDGWPGGTRLKLPLPPLQSVTSITYRDENGDENTFAPANTIVDIAVEPGRIVLAKDASWPSAALYPASPITVRFVAGYGDTADDVPQAIRQAILLLVGHWYENRETVLVGTVSKELEFTFQALLWPYRAFGEM